ncbi:MAG: peptidase S41 [Pedobacter sp.]|nr:MAG: peptidase S41 [Pedobacter sp.]
MRNIYLSCVLLIMSCTHSKPVFNGSFEAFDKKTQMPSGWLFGFNTDQQKAYRIQVDSFVRQNMRFSISIEKIGNDADFYALDYSINKIFDGDQVTLSGFIKTQDVESGYAGLWMRFNESPVKLYAFENMKNHGIRGTKDWQEVSITLPYDAAKVKSMHFGGLLVGDGKAWFDNMKILINDKPIGEVQLKSIKSKKADLDTSFRYSSGINNIALDEQQKTNLVLAGQFWAFLKYHHPSIAAGELNWDAELFKLLSNVLGAKNNQTLSIALESFLDKLPTPKACTKCDALTRDKYELKPDYGSLFNTGIVNESLRNKLTYVLHNRNTDDGYYLRIANNGNPEFSSENAYLSMNYPDAGYRLLSLFRFWGMINYYFPYRNVIGEDWNAVLSSSLVDFVQAKSDMDYSLACLKLIARIKDTHANIFGFNKALNQFKGKYAAPFQAQFIEQKLVITALHTDTLNVKKMLKVGDIITKIGDVDLDKLVKKFLPLTAGSNYETQLRDLPAEFLLRSNADKVKLTIKRGTRAMEYITPMGNLNYAYKDPFYDRAVPYKIMKENIGYIFPGKYKNIMLPEIKKHFKNVKGMIIDMRCYPNEFMPFTFGAFLKSEQSPFVKFTVGSPSFPGAFRFVKPIDNGGITYSNNSSIDQFLGRVIVIVNSTTQSQAEYTTMAFQSSKNVKVLGSTTAGADGDVSSIVLPGGVITRISGLGVFYPDGRPTQRLGVKIDYKVYPTINGITSGKDELLDKAKELLIKGW